jgi:predicted Zn-dependent protease
MKKNSKFNIAVISALSVCCISTSSYAISSGEILRRATNAAFGVGAAMLTKITPAQETQIGAQMKTQVFTTYKEYTGNSALLNYVRSVGTKVVNIASRKKEINYQFYILESPEVNAFTIPGGSVFITTECLKYIKNEAELAGVLAHEVGHNERKHTTDTIKRAMAAQGIAQGAFSQNDPALVKVLAGLSLNLILNGYSRKQEKEADETGTSLITRLGYQPKALISFLQTLLAYAGRDPSKFAQLFQTHPGSQERIKNLTAYIAKNRLAVAKPITNDTVFRKYIAVLPAKVSVKAGLSKP